MERNFSTLSYARPHATTSGCVCLEGRFERPTIQVEWYGFHKARRQIKDCYSVEETATHTTSKALAISKKTAPVNLFFQKFIDTLSTRRVICSVVLW